MPVVKAVSVSRAAAAEVDSILDWYLSQGEFDRAVKVQTSFAAAFRRIGANPGVGHFRDDLTTQPVRFLNVHGYLVVYEETDCEVLVHHVLHGARDVERILHPDRPPRDDED